MPSRRHFIALAGSLAAASAFGSLDVEASSVAFTVGEFKRIYDPSPTPEEKWYINDHTILRALDGIWHLIGITHAEPSSPGRERIFAHATAPAVTGPWTRQEPLLPFDPKAGETVVWAPYVLEHGGTYWMYYCGGGPGNDKFRIHLATSKDLYQWERSPANPMVIDGFDARDPMVVRIGSEWVMYYCATSTPLGGNHTVKAMTSTDLIHWSEPRTVFTHPLVGTFGGPTESPFVVERKGKFYLFLCTNKPYSDTAAYVSKSAFHWEFADRVGEYPAHASEIVHDSEHDRWYATRAGWGAGGVYLADLVWK